jgi:hypothetical protein
MKKLLFVFGLVLVVSLASAQTNKSYRYQSGYYKPSTRTYIQPHYKTNNNQTNWDNYSTKGNTNVWTGTTGSRARDYSIDANNYGRGKTIYTRPKGGQYYKNNNYSKTYVPKRYK